MLYERNTLCFNHFAVNGTQSLFLGRGLSHIGFIFVRQGRVFMKINANEKVKNIN